MTNDKPQEGRRVSVVGAGVSGRAIAELAASLGARVFVSDMKDVAKDTAKSFNENGIAWEERGNTERVLEADEIVVSSGVSPNAPIVKEAFAKGIKVTGELDFVSPYLKGIVIAVTGSNGKTTTASMIGYFLDQMGYSAVTCGNIGHAVARAALRDYDFIVLELSSFQLYWAKNFLVDLAVVTNLAPDHIDWHGSYENYTAAKANIINCLAPGAAAIYQKRDEETLSIKREDIERYPLCWKEQSPDVKGVYLDCGVKAAWINGGGCRMKHRLFLFDDVKLLGNHNLENAAMALGALALFNINDVPRDVVSSYVPPKHRCAFAGRARGVTFVDDSKGTNVAATVAAMTSIAGKKVMILGGQGKGEDYAPLAGAVSKNAREAVIIGAEKEKIARALQEAGYENYKFAPNMEEAVKAAFDAACDGDVVLLSPACTSWDMYKNYNERGEHFCSVVKELISKEA